MMKLKFLLLMSLWLFGQSIFADDLRGDTIEISSYQLNIDLRDFDTRILHGLATMDIQARQNEVSQISLDLLRLIVDSVKVNSHTAVFTYDDSLLGIHFSKVLNRGDSATLLVYYHGKPGVVSGDFGGFYWDEQFAYNIGVSFVSDPHNYGRVWFPCFDNFKVRSRYEYFITTRNTDKAFCNGVLLDEKTDSSGSVWHWKLQEEIPSYLASVAVSAYQTLRDTVMGMNGIKPVELAVLPEDTAVLKKLFKHLHQAFHILEHYWGPYRWERVGYCVVPFHEGAMEHATNIAFMERYLNLYPRECEVTMAHELSHHWFGNLVTCESASEMWLNEGWASYSQDLFIEGLYGPDSARWYRRENHTNEIQSTHISDNGYLPLSGVPTKYTYGSTVYQKGRGVIQTLRYYLGDSSFFNCVRGYLNHYAFKTANTAQMCDYLSACSGKDLTEFFNDWVLAPGYPHFSISDKYIKRVHGRYEVYINIRQRLSHAPKLYNKVPVTVSYFDHAMKRKDEVVFAGGENATYASVLDFKPEFIALDFGENLAEAITHEWRIVRDTGIFDFSNAMMTVQIQSIKDSSLIRCEQNWLPADPMIVVKTGLHLHHARYWTVDGVFDPSMKAAGIFEYSAVTGDHLDEDFITHEDSLVMMYRPNEEADWKLANSFFVDKGGNDSDMIGSIIVYPLKKGEYAMAVYDSKFPTEVRKMNDVAVLSAVIKVGNDFKIYWDKTRMELVTTFGKGIFEWVEMCDANGKTIVAQKITDTENKINLKPGYTTNASYVVTLTTKSGKRISKKFNN